jgi:beta-glucosidase
VKGKPRYDFKGKLSFSWPKTPLQEKLNPQHPAYDPLFALGYGLNYATNEQGPGKLAENVPGVAKEEAEIRFYVGGQLLQPWLISFKDQGRGTQLLSGEIGVLPAEDVTVRLSDKDAHNDAATMSWQGAQLARMALDQGGRSIDLSQYLQQGALSFDLKVSKPLSDALELVIGCGTDCERRTALNQKADSKWQTVVVKVSCFAKPGDTLEGITNPFALESKGSGEVSVANVRWIKSGKADTECPN